MHHYYCMSTSKTHVAGSYEESCEEYYVNTALMTTCRVATITFLQFSDRFPKDTSNKSLNHNNVEDSANRLHHRKGIFH